MPALVPPKPKALPPITPMPAPVPPPEVRVVQAPAPVVNFDPAPIANAVERQAETMAQAVAQLAAAVAQLAPAAKLEVTVTSYNTQGRIKTLEIARR